MASRLPPEVWDQIIWYICKSSQVQQLEFPQVDRDRYRALQDSLAIRDLRAMQLVNSTLYEFASRQLYEEIGRHYFINHKRSIRQSWQWWHCLLALSKGRHAPYVKKLALAIEPESRGAFDWDEHKVTSEPELALLKSLRCDLLPRILPKFTGLSSLTFAPPPDLKLNVIKADDAGRAEFEDVVVDVLLMLAPSQLQSLHLEVPPCSFFARLFDRLAPDAVATTFRNVQKLTIVATRLDEQEWVIAKYGAAAAERLVGASMMHLDDLTWVSRGLGAAGAAQVFEAAILKLIQAAPGLHTLKLDFILDWNFRAAARELRHLRVLHLERAAVSQDDMFHLLDANRNTLTEIRLANVKYSGAESIQRLLRSVGPLPCLARVSIVESFWIVSGAEDIAGMSRGVRVDDYVWRTDMSDAFESWNWLGARSPVPHRDAFLYAPNLLRMVEQDT